MGEADLTGRVAENAQAGNLTGDQAQQLYGQVATIHTQIATDKAADGGTLSASDAQAIHQSLGQLSQTIYGDTHGASTAPARPEGSKAGVRETTEAGRIAINEKAGNLTSDQAQQLGSQLTTIQGQIATDEQADGGKLNQADAQAINQQQNQLSQQIRDTAHDITTPNKPVVNAT